LGIFTLGFGAFDTGTIRVKDLSAVTGGKM